MPWTKNSHDLEEKLEDLCHKTSKHCKSTALKHCGNQEQINRTMDYNSKCRNKSPYIDY